MAKNQQNGIAQNLESEATKNSQPNKLFIPGSKSIPGADPEQPSINNATRREKYNITPSYDKGASSDIPESTKIGIYDTVSPKTIKSYTTSTAGGDEYLGYIKKLGESPYDDTLVDERIAEINQSLLQDGIDATNSAYGQYVTQATKELAKIDMQLGQLKAQKNRISAEQSSNAELVYTLAKEVWKGITLGKSVQDMAKELGQDERVIQKIVNGQEEELVQLNQEWADEQMRQYLRNREDLDTQIARNITQFQNTKANLDYQFNSSIQTLERQLFDAEWSAKTTSAIYGMTGTEYVLNRIKTQYQQQMDDLENTYNYQSANAQIAINNALEDYATDIQRWAQDYDIEMKGLQGYVLQNLQNIQNNIGLTNDQVNASLLSLKQNIQSAQSSAMQMYLTNLEAGNNKAATQIANAYGLSSMQMAGMGSYSPYNSGAEGDLRGKIGVGIADKTNNVGSLKVSSTSEALKKLWDEAGIKYSNEGISNVEGAFWTFETVQDGIKALELALKGRNGNATPAYLKQKGAWAMADLPGNLMNKKIKDMTSEEFNTLLRSIIKGENVQAYNLLKNGVGLGGEGAGTTGYDKNYAEEYKTYLSSSKGWDAFKKSTQDSLIQQFGSMDNFIKNAQAYSEEVVQPQQAKTFQESLDVVVEFNKAWNKLSDREKKTVKRLGVKDSYQNWLYNDDINNAVNLYRQIMGQGFVNTIIESKKAGASYGPLSDNEGNSIRDSFTALKLNAPEYAQTYIDYIIWDLSTAITELGQTPDTTRGLQRNVGNNIMNQNSQNEFNTPGSMNTGMNNTGTNYLGQQQSGLVTTGANQQWGQ